jgi:hypothetical protein
MCLTRREILRVGTGALSLLAVGEGFCIAPEEQQDMSHPADGRSNASSSARVATVAMHSVMGEPQVNLDRITDTDRKFGLVQKRSFWGDSIDRMGVPSGDGGDGELGWRRARAGQLRLKRS